MKTIFISSSGRSGSKSVASTLSTLPNVRSYHGPAHEALEVLNYMDAIETESDPIDWWPLSSTLTERVARAHDEGCHYVESTWCAQAIGPRLRRYFPGCRILHLVRHPEDFIRSGLSRNWFNYDPVYRASVNALSRDLWPLDQHSESWTRVQKIASLWVKQQADILNGGTNGVLRFEDLRDQGIDLEVLGIGTGRVPLLFENATETHTAPPKEEWPAEWHEQVRAIATPMAEHFGYEL